MGDGGIGRKDDEGIGSSSLAESVVQPMTGDENLRRVTGNDDKRRLSRWQERMHSEYINLEESSVPKHG